MAFGLKRRKKKKSENGRFFAAKQHFRVENAHARARDILRKIDPINLKFRGMIQMPKTFKMTLLDFWLNKNLFIYLY